MIDEKIQSELRQKFNPEGSDIRKLQLRLLRILKFIDEICRTNNIQYWLSSGTCLGAVRHRGFIPWDDDIDIEMFEDDYKKFIKVMTSYDKNDYVLQTKNTDANYHLPFGKIRDCNSFIEEDYGYDKKYKYRGCFIDVFPIAPSNSIRLFSLGCLIEVKLLEADHANSKFEKIIWQSLSTICMPILKFFSSLGNRKVYRHTIGSFFPKKRNFEDVKETTLINFEDAQFPVPINYNSYLTRLYGDYMRIPELDKIHFHTSKFRIF